MTKLHQTQKRKIVNISPKDKAVVKQKKSSAADI